jgi:hypothetical protein
MLGDLEQGRAHARAGIMLSAQQAAQQRNAMNPVKCIELSVVIHKIVLNKVYHGFMNETTSLVQELNVYLIRRI